MQVIFLPFTSFRAQDAILGVVALDLVGLFGSRFLGWRTALDHGGHLAAVAFGLLYVHYGHRLVQRLQEEVATEWRILRRELRAR